MYSIVITDPENSHKRSLELSGDGLYLIFHSFTHSVEFHSFFVLLMQLKIEVETWLPFKYQAPPPPHWLGNRLQQVRFFHKKLGFILVTTDSTGQRFSYRKCVIISQRTTQNASFPSTMLDMFLTLPNIGALCPCGVILHLTKLCCEFFVTKAITAQYCGC